MMPLKHFNLVLNVMIAHFQQKAKRTGYRERSPAKPARTSFWLTRTITLAQSASFGVNSPDKHAHQV